ncbi:MAG: rubredoxin [Saprospiraceae bacterium]
MKEDLLRVMVKGGALSPIDLRQIVETAESLGLSSILLGSRQDILLEYHEPIDNIARQLPNFNVEYVSNRTFQNIVSSYVSADIFSATSWLNGATYLYILEQFQYLPKLEINITDSRQRLVPLFTGQLNFIASEQEDYWYLYLRFDGEDKVQQYPVWTHSWDIHSLCREIEKHWDSVKDAQQLFELVNAAIELNNRNISKPLQIPFIPFPYYEGMNRMGVEQYWLGLYWRNNQYDLAFLHALADLCMESRIGKICLTPWKSLIIKGIPAEDKILWEKLLGSYGINVRHSSLELNWHLPVSNPDALELKRFLVRNFDQNDISTYGLTFGISTGYSPFFTSIVIRKNPPPKVAQGYDIRPTFDVMYCEDFDPNNLNYQCYAQDVDKIELAGLLMELSRMYFSQLGEKRPSTSAPVTTSEPIREQIEINAFQCPDCMTVYDSRFGDEVVGIAAGTPFEQLPDDYCCGVCEAPKGAFLAV